VEDDLKYWQGTVDTTLKSHKEMIEQTNKTVADLDIKFSGRFDKVDGKLDHIAVGIKKTDGEQSVWEKVGDRAWQAAVALVSVGLGWFIHGAFK
jgi:hypothetical protein